MTASEISNSDGLGFQPYYGVGAKDRLPNRLSEASCLSTSDAVELAVRRLGRHQGVTLSPTLMCDPTTPEPSWA